MAAAHSLPREVAPSAEPHGSQHGHSVPTVAKLVSMVEYMPDGTGHEPRDEDDTAVPTLHPEVLQHVMSQDPHAPLHIVSVIGPLRTGKSTLLTRLVKLPTQVKKPTAGSRVASPLFSVDHGAATHTRGVDVALKLYAPSDLLALESGGSSSKSILLLDVEGAGSEGTAHDLRLMTPAICLSKVVIWRVRYTGRDELLNKLELLVKVASALRKTKSGGAAASGRCFGHLIISVVDAQQYDVEANGALEEQILNMEPMATRKGPKHRNKIRSEIRAAFQSVRVMGHASLLSDEAAYQDGLAEIGSAIRNACATPHLLFGESSAPVTQHVAVDMLGELVGACCRETVALDTLQLWRVFQERTVERAAAAYLASLGDAVQRPEGPVYAVESAADIECSLQTVIDAHGIGRLVSLLSAGDGQGAPQAQATTTPSKQRGASAGFIAAGAGGSPTRSPIASARSPASAFAHRVHGASQEGKAALLAQLESRDGIVQQLVPHATKHCLQLRQLLTQIHDTAEQEHDIDLDAPAAYALQAMLRISDEADGKESHAGGHMIESTLFLLQSLAQQITAARKRVSDLLYATLQRLARITADRCRKAAQDEARSANQGATIARVLWRAHCGDFDRVRDVARSPSRDALRGMQCWLLDAADAASSTQAQSDAAAAVALALELPFSSLLDASAVANVSSFCDGEESTALEAIAATLAGREAEFEAEQAKARADAEAQAAAHAKEQAAVAEANAERQRQAAEQAAAAATAAANELEKERQNRSRDAAEHAARMEKLEKEHRSKMREAQRAARAQRPQIIMCIRRAIGGGGGGMSMGLPMGGMPMGLPMGGMSMGLPTGGMRMPIDVSGGGGGMSVPRICNSGGGGGRAMNPWNAFQHAHRGQGFSSSQLSAMYKRQK